MEPNGRLILLVDDDIEIAEVLSTAVSKWGYGFQSLESTYLARKWMAQNRPSLILLDIMMPDGNGLDFCRWVRSQEQISDTPIIVISGLTDETLLGDALELGAMDVLQKPIRMDLLEHKVKRLIRGADGG